MLLLILNGTHFCCGTELMMLLVVIAMVVCRRPV